MELSSPFTCEIMIIAVTLCYGHRLMSSVVSNQSNDIIRKRSVYLLAAPFVLNGIKYVSGPKYYPILTCLLFAQFIGMIGSDTD